VRVSFVTSGFCLSVCLSVRHALFFRISLRDLCRRLLARLTSATKFVYFENRKHETSSRGAPLRTLALIDRYTHSESCVRTALECTYGHPSTAKRIVLRAANYRSHLELSIDALRFQIGLTVHAIKNI
jgi:hypothetical protein